jgi:hypothetical protein
MTLDAMNRRLAVSWFVNPILTNCRTSRWRALKLPLQLVFDLLHAAVDQCLQGITPHTQSRFILAGSFAGECYRQRDAFTQRLAQPHRQPTIGRISVILAGDRILPGIPQRRQGITPAAEALAQLSLITHGAVSRRNL